MKLIKHKNGRVSLCWMGVITAPNPIVKRVGNVVRIDGHNVRPEMLIDVFFEEERLPFNNTQEGLIGLFRAGEPKIGGVRIPKTQKGTKFHVATGLKCKKTAFPIVTEDKDEVVFDLRSVEKTTKLVDFYGDKIVSVQEIEKYEAEKSK